MGKQSIAGIIVVDDLVFIGKRLPKGQMANRWEFPGGKVEEGESHKDALVREFEEEFMIEIEVGERIAKAELSNIKGRYVKINVGTSSAWINISEIEIFDK